MRVKIIKVLTENADIKNALKQYLGRCLQSMMTEAKRFTGLRHWGHLSQNFEQIDEP